LSAAAYQTDGGWGWVVTGATFVLLFIAYGNAYAFGVYFHSLSSAFAADRAETSLVFSIVGGLYSSLGIVSGPAADRFGTRPVCLTGMLALAAGLMYASTAVALWQVYVGFGLGVSFGMGCNFAPANAGLQRWFTRRRGLASGLASAGVALSILLMPSIVAWLIEWRDWRAAMWTIGVMTLVVGSAAALLMKDPPNTTGRSDSMSDDVRPGFDLRAALSSRAFVMLYLSSMFCCVGIFIPFVHLVPYAVDEGLRAGTGVYFIAVIGASSLVGRVGFTAASDRLGRRNSLAAMYVGMSAGLLLWYVAALGVGEPVTVLTLFAVVFGLGYGGYVAMVGPITAEYFGTEKIGSMLGCFMSSIAVGGFLGPWLAGLAFDRWGSYNLPIAFSGALGLAAAVLVMKMPAQPYAAAHFLRPTPE
jgi:OFA family oxalate/formate antiporter-like MFS transporter